MYVCVDAGHQGGVCVYSYYYNIVVVVAAGSSSSSSTRYSDSATGTSAMFRFGWAALIKVERSAGVGRRQDTPPS